MDLRNSNGIELRNFYFSTVKKLFFENFHQKWTMHLVELNSGISKPSE